MSDGTSFSSLGVYVGTDWKITCHTYTVHTPILSLDAGQTALTISVEGREATGPAVQFARELARQAARFAAEVERLHAELLAESDSGVCPGCGGAVAETAV